MLALCLMGCVTLRVGSVPEEIGSGDVARINVEVKDQGQPVANSTVTYQVTANPSCGALNNNQSQTANDGTTHVQFTGASVNEKCDATVQATANSSAATTGVTVWPDIESQAFTSSGDPIATVTLTKRTQTRWEYRVECTVLNAPSVGSSACHVAPINIRSSAMPRCTVTATTVDPQNRQPSIVTQAQMASIVDSLSSWRGWRILDVVLECTDVQEGTVEFRLYWAGTTPAGPHNITITGPSL